MKKVTIEELVKMLKTKEEVKFQFVKKDGTLREARGTMITSIIKPHLRGGESTTKARGLITYFDLDKGQFRCFDPLRFEGVIE